MKAVILAAGAATRMRPLTLDRPKCLLPVGGVPILKRTVAALATHGLEGFVVVTGYLGGQIDRALSAWFEGLSFEVVTNEAWSRTNNAYSLLLARSAVGSSPMLLVDGDVLFDPAIVDLVLRSPYPDCFALRSTRDLGAEEMKVELDFDGRLVAIGKEIAPDRAAGESVGFFRLKSAVPAVFGALADRIERRGLTNEWYESALDQAARKGTAIHAVDVGSRFIAEVDTPEDLAAAEAALGRHNL